jgi:hypothetical protein
MSRVALLLLLVSVSALAQPGYTDSMYRRALENESTAPSYVLVSLRNDEAELARLVCIPAPFLLGAIHAEYHLGYDDSGSRQALAKALEQPGRVFSFTDARARDNVQPRYSAEVLSQTRERLSAMSDAQLREEARNQAFDGFNPADRDAVAHVLLERGILVGIADRTGRIYLAE